MTVRTGPEAFKLFQGDILHAVNVSTFESGPAVISQRFEGIFFGVNQEVFIVKKMEREKPPINLHLSDVACVDSQLVVGEIKRRKICLLRSIEDSTGVKV